MPVISRLVSPPLLDAVNHGTYKGPTVSVLALPP
jgi:hypothetical protein